jgi:hypothetical protein
LNPALVTTLGTRCASTLAVQPATVNPRLESVTPSAGPVSGGNTVVLTGANLSASSQVRFGAVPALTVLVDGPFRIRAEAPAGDAGPVDVTVENPGGQATLPSAYTYAADTTPPVFTTPLYVASEALVEPSGAATVTATLKWTTNEEATTRIDYGTGALSQNLAVPGFRTAHSVELTGLAPGATYLFQATPPTSRQLRRSTPLGAQPAARERSGHDTAGDHQ